MPICSRLVAVKENTLLCLMLICCNISKMYLIVNCDYLVFRFTLKLIDGALSLFRLANL